jgi:hypothetical protein
MHTATTVTSSSLRSVAVVVLAGLVGSCSGPDAAPDSEAPSPTSAVTVNVATPPLVAVEEPASDSSVADPAGTVPGSGLDLAHDAARFERDREFFRNFGAPGADWGVQFASIEEMTGESHAVIVGTVVGNVEGPSFPAEADVNPELDEGEGDLAYTLTAYDIRVDQVVAGHLPVGETHVRIGPGGPPMPTAEYGPALMFLWWGGQGYEDRESDDPPAIVEWDRSGYRLTSPQGALVAGPEGAVNIGTTDAAGFRGADQQTYADPVAEQVRHMTLTDVAELVAGTPTYDP